jgi:hypothetical protein
VTGGVEVEGVDRDCDPLHRCQTALVLGRETEHEGAQERDGGIGVVGRLGVGELVEKVEYGFRIESGATCRMAAM